MPYEVSEIVLTAPESVATGERLPVHILVKAKKAAPGTHLVHVTVSRIPAHPLPYYARDVVCPKGEGDTYVPLALNDTPGMYVVEACDVLSGVSSRVMVKVGPKAELH